MKIKIQKVEEKEGLLRVHVEHEFGFDNIGISLDKKKINHITGKPKWVEEVIQLLKAKYKDAKLPDGKEYEGSEIDTDDS